MFALFLPALIGALVAAVGSIVGRAIIAAGVGFVTYTGIGIALASMKNFVMSSLTGIPGDAAGILGYLGFDRAVMIIFSAVTASMALRAVGNSVKKVVLK